MPALKQIGITVDCPDAEESAAFWERCLVPVGFPGTGNRPVTARYRRLRAHRFARAPNTSGCGSGDDDVSRSRHRRRSRHRTLTWAPGAA